MGDVRDLARVSSLPPTLPSCVCIVCTRGLLVGLSTLPPVFPRALL